MGKQQKMSYLMSTQQRQENILSKSSETQDQEDKASFHFHVDADIQGVLSCLSTLRPPCRLITCSFSYIGFCFSHINTYNRILLGMYPFSSLVVFASSNERFDGARGLGLLVDYFCVCKRAQEILLVKGALQPVVLLGFIDCLKIKNISHHCPKYWKPKVGYSKL